MKRKLSALLGACSLFAGLAVSGAQEEQQGEPECPPGEMPVPVQPPAYVPAPAPTHVRHEAAYSPQNMSLTIGGGVGNFARDRISDLNSSVAGVWDARYLYGTRHFLGFEGEYLGSAAGGSDTFNTGNTVTQQFSGSLRFNLTRARIQPFLTGGAGWANLRRDVGVTFGNATLSQTGNSFIAPFGAGISGYFLKHGVVDVRGSYTLVTDKDFTNTGARPDMWMAELRAGYAF
jgi:hypothetical protein